MDRASWGNAAGWGCAPLDRLGRLLLRLMLRRSLAALIWQGRLHHVWGLPPLGGAGWNEVEHEGQVRVLVVVWVMGMERPPPAVS